MNSSARKLIVWTALGGLVVYEYIFLGAEKHVEVSAYPDAPSLNVEVEMGTPTMTVSPWIDVDLIPPTQTLHKNWTD